MIEETTLQQIEARCDAPQVQWKEIHDDVRLLLAEVRRVYAWAAEMQEMAEKAKPAFSEITEAYTKLDRRVTELKSQLSNEEDEHSKDRKSMLSFQSKLIESDEENVSLRNQVAQLEVEIKQMQEAPAPDEMFITQKEWAGLSAKTRHRLNQWGQEVNKVTEDMDTLQSKFDRISDWCKAYPLDVFPEPDFKLARQLLEAGGVTLDAVSASNMRHVVEGIARIINEGSGS
jgi:chromosome segregation ATPase